MGHRAPEVQKVATNYVMRMSANGQVSIPAATRSRWHAERLVVVDLGDRIVLRPLPDEPVAALVGKYRGRGPSTADARGNDREEDARIGRRKAT